jgi:hypothetical protein
MTSFPPIPESDLTFLTPKPGALVPCLLVQPPAGGTHRPVPTPCHAAGYAWQAVRDPGQ